MGNKEFYMTTDDGKNLYCSCWLPEEGHWKGIVQILHGMAEHIGRYGEFALELNKAGYAVYGHDQRGHGQSISPSQPAGFFAETAGFSRVAEDAKQLSFQIRKSRPELPLYLFGHSMGSFVARRCVQLYGDQLSGAIFSGTGSDPGLLGSAGRALAIWETKRKGALHPSSLLDALSFGGFNRPFRPNRTPFDWLSRDQDQVDRYIEDPLCGHISTAGFFADLFSGMKLIHRPEEIRKVPASLPLLFISGDHDPVGKNGKSVMKSARQYREAGAKDVTVKLYPGARHELLNELNRDEVFRYVIEWMDDTMQYQPD